MTATSTPVARQPGQRSTLRRLVRHTAITVGSATHVNQILDSRRADHPLRHVVVVTGPHRSGTTILGELLNHARRTFLVHEPFNLEWGLQDVPRRYPAMTADEVDSPPAHALRHFLTTGGGVWLGDGKPLPNNHRRPREFRRRARGLRPWGYTAIIKDPFLLLALRWINSGLSTRPPVVTLRHPGAWVASLRRRRMHPWAALASFREQNGFGDPIIQELLAEAEWEREDLITASAVTWSCLVRMLDVQLDAGAHATVVRMEDFSTRPNSVIREVYTACGLTAPDNLDRIIERYTSESNVVTPRGRVLHELRRNSAALASAWRDRLSAVDQAQIRSITDPHATRWYPQW